MIGEDGWIQWGALLSYNFTLSLLMSLCYVNIYHNNVLFAGVLKVTVLYCTVLYCTVLYCTVLYCTVLYCTVLYCTVLYCTVLYCTVLYCTVFSRSDPWRAWMFIGALNKVTGPRATCLCFRRTTGCT